MSRHPRHVSSVDDAVVALCQAKGSTMVLWCCHRRMIALLLLSVFINWRRKPTSLLRVKIGPLALLQELASTVFEYMAVLLWHPVAILL
jgi:hypothetical protein